MKNYVYTDLSVRDSLTMQVEGIAAEFEVVQFSASFAANEVPTAAVMLPIGRDAGNPKRRARIHASAKLLTQMMRVAVWFNPQWEYDRETNWPADRFKVFDGFFTGFSYRKISGKVHVVANLTHWIAALSFSSSLTRNGHVSNPTQLNAAAVIESLNTGGAGQGNLISLLAPMQVCAPDVGADLWKAIKTVFCKLAGVETMPVGPANECLGDGTYTRNDVALEALARIEGPAEDCPLPYTYGVPLRLADAGITSVTEAVAMAIGNETVESYASASFWDKLVGQFCPMFGMAVVPMIETAVVVADTPAYRGGFWKQIEADEYDSYDTTRELHRPLRGVGVVASYDSQTKAGVTEPGDLGEDGYLFPAVGGCYVEDSVRPADGMIVYVAPPSWLRVLRNLPNYAADTTGIGGEQPGKTGTTPVDPPTPAAPTPDTLGQNANALYRRFAHDVYVGQMMRGHGGSISGKLRFDIAPLSIVKIDATSEKFIGPGQDDLAETIIGCVQRVTVAINAEAAMAGTTITLSHVRTEAENARDRTSVAAHPLFGDSIHGGGKHGSPLSPMKPVPRAANLFAGDGPVQPGPVV